MLKNALGIIVAVAVLIVTVILVQIFKTVMFDRKVSEEDKYKKLKKELLVMSVCWAIIVVLGMFIILL